MVIPAKKGEIVDTASKAVLEVEGRRLDGAITAGERHNKIIDIWHRATEQVSGEMFSDMRRVEAESGEFNPIFMMADSGARGSKEQVRQLAGMRGLMSKPSGEVIETPITANFRYLRDARGVCRLCYGRNLASGKLVEIGEVSPPSRSASRARSSPCGSLS